MRRLLLVFTIMLTIILVGIVGFAEELDAAELDAEYEPWRVAYIATNSPDELLPLYASADVKSTTLGGYYAGVKVMFNESDIADEADVGPLVPVCIGLMDSPASTTGFMERERLIEWDGDDPDADRPVPYSPVLFVQNPGGLGWLNLRERPSSSARVVEQYRNGARIEVLGVVGEWLHVAPLDSSLTGFMMPQFLSSIESARVLTTDEFTFGHEELPITIQLLETGAREAVGIVQVLDTRHDIVQTITVETIGQLDRDANFILEDMNFDGYPDFRVMLNFANSRTEYQYWMFEPSAEVDDAVNPWRFVRSEAFDILENEPSFDAAVKRVYTRWRPDDREYPTYIDAVYDLADGSPRLIEALETTLMPDGTRMYRQFELQEDEMTLMHEWSERMD
ncbi:hypothetical protein AGMMS49992_16730 [Clostridia bacterium]|nr:hypothetical protein AGMMS49992_16730 [Clostridia bacterium]